ncbi:MAG: phenol hydroxylase [Alphaproteobacteria bacterium]|nr:MAG: phenol hydroxylase [Alphaproteobacteria bacterium]
MSVAAIGKYDFPALDRQENFHGNILTYWHWEKHLMFCSPIALPLAPDMPFGAVVEQVMPGAYGAHPDFAKIDWAKVSWRLNGAPFKPERDKSLRDNGLGHKSVVTFATPGLDGIGGCAS